MESNTFYDIYLEELKNLPQGTPEEEAAQVSALLKEEMEGAFPLSVRLVADVSQGENWYEAKK